MLEQYRIFTIRQGSKVRRIEAPNDELKAKQRSLIGFFESYQSFYPGAVARAGRSVLSNAAPHQGAYTLFKTDIKSFYPSITLTHLLRNFDLDGRPEWIKEARKLVIECLLPVGGELVLPTGAPTSPILCNIAATDLDLELADISKQYGYAYTRYIDDLTFSTKGTRNIEFKNKVLASILAHGFRYNGKKTEWATPNNDRKFEVTGVSLRESKVPKEIRRLCRVRLDKIARDNIPLDKVTQGYMSYIQMLDPITHRNLMDYLEKRKARYVSLNR